METILLEFVTTFILGTIIISEIKIIDKSEKRKLIKKNKYQNFKVIDKAPILKLTKTNKQSNIKDNPELEEIVQTFLNRLSIYITEEEMKFIKNNIQTLQYKKSNPLILKLTNSIGYYSSRKHYIAASQNKKIDTETFKHIIYHELLHAVTSYNTKENYHTGFNLTNKKNKKQIGKLLNEGYTELLTKRIFGPNDNVGYEYEVAIAELIEFIIGTDEMKKLFFNLDLEGLINELAKYNNINKVKQFILNLDTIHYLYNEKGQYERETLVKLYNEVSIFLYESFQNKVEQTINIHNLEFYDFISNKFIKLFNEVARNSKFAVEEREQTIKELEKAESNAYEEYLKEKRHYEKEENNKSKKLVNKKYKNYNIFNNKGFINILTITTLLTIISILSIGVSYLLLQVR